MLAGCLCGSPSTNIPWGEFELLHSTGQGLDWAFLASLRLIARDLTSVLWRAGNLASRAKEGSPFLKTVQGFLALRRSSGSGLSVAYPVDQAGSAPETFSPLGSGLSTAASAEPPAAAPPKQATAEAPQHTAAQAGASAAKASAMADVFERAEEQQCAAKPAQATEAGLLSVLAAEAALKAQEKGLKTPGECLKPSPVTPRMGASEASSGGGSALLQGSPVVTVGTAEPTHKKKALRSPLRSPVAAERSPTLPQAPDMGSLHSPAATAQALAEGPGVHSEAAPVAAPPQPGAAPASPAPAEAATGTSHLALALQAHVRDCASKEVAAADPRPPEVQTAILTAETTEASGVEPCCACSLLSRVHPEGCLGRDCNHISSTGLLMPRVLGCSNQQIGSRLEF